MEFQLLKWNTAKSNSQWKHLEKVSVALWLAPQVLFVR